MALIANIMLVALSLFMGLRLLAQYRQRPRQHTLWYGIGLLLTAVAATPELVQSLTKTVPLPLWWAYWMSASTLVGALAVGSGYLLSPRFGPVAAGVVGALTTWIIIATVTGVGPAPEGAEYAIFLKAPPEVKLPFVLQNILGALTIFGVAIWSFVRTRGLYNAWIALGTLLFSSGGTLANRGFDPWVFYAAQAAGIVLLYLGVTGAGAKRSARVQQATEG